MQRIRLHQRCADGYGRERVWRNQPLGLALHDCFIDYVLFRTGYGQIEDKRLCPTVKAAASDEDVVLPGASVRV